MCPSFPRLLVCPLFNVHVNDIEDCIHMIPVSTCKYADDCTLYELVSKDSVSQMQDAVTHLESWAVQNKMELNAKKTSPSRSPVQFHLLLVSGLTNWRELRSLNCWVCMYRTISSGIHMFQVLSAKRVKGSTLLGSAEQPISPGTLV